MRHLWRSTKHLICNNPSSPLLGSGACNIPTTFHPLSTRPNIVAEERVAATPSAFSARVGPDRVLPATSPAAVNLDGVVQLRMGEGLGSLEPVSCYTAISKTVNTVPGNVALVDGERKWTYEQYFQDINTVAKGFIELGLQPHRTVSIIGSNSPEWFQSAVGAVFAGGCSSGVYITNNAHSVLYQLKHSKTNIAVVQDYQQLDKILPFRDDLPDLETIVMYGERPMEPGVMSWNELINIGASVSDTELRNRLENQAVNQPAVLCYTSGTTTHPKGALLSQDNITWTCASAAQTYNAKYGEEIVISYLPVSHIVAQIIDVWLAPFIGGTVHFADKDALKGTLLNTLTAVRPTRFVAVPRVYEKIHSQLEKQFSELGGSKARLVNWCRNVTTQHYDSILSGGPGLGVKFTLAEKLLLSKIHAKLGLDRCLHGMGSGAAPLAIETIDFLKSIGIIVSELYGMTEIPNQTANQFHPEEGGSRIRLGSVGRTAFGTQTKLHLKDPQDGIGEVAANGRNVFMGYLSDSTKTRETFDRGFWLLTGDMATIDDQGFVTIKGRIKDIIITSGGKNIAPYPIEEKVKALLPDLVSNCMVVGDKQKHLALLITVRAVVDPASLEITDQLEACAWEFCRTCGHEPVSVSDLAANKDKYDGVYDAILSVVETVNKETPSKAAKVRKFTILPQDFSVSGGELGPTMKLKRYAVEQKYADVIENMYATTDRTSLWDA
eukprot:TRINITY_DN9282_c0_g3_i1.p1 TRINITY_DN9282_c0_g3~~TRINITY_DN9282_c0_g3_i1.p1  ORF type:complete len:722 (-),score=191.14 TRINITY_DN9282_c0_g3_i1:615-2780(-)